jgi:hypothetical protein
LTGHRSSIPAHWPMRPPLEHNVGVKILVWAGALGLGALVAVLLGLSMLAASQTTSRVATPAAPWKLLASAQMKALSSVSVPEKGPGSLNVPCVGKVQIGVGSITTTWTGETQLVLSPRLARCLRRHGFLSRSDLASFLSTKPTRTRHGPGRVVSQSLQLDPSPLSLGGWSLLVGLELAGAALFIRSVRRDRRRPAPSSR